MELSIQQRQAIAIAEAESSAENAEAGFSERVLSLDPMGLSVAKSQNDAFGTWLRTKAAERQPGETDEEMFKRQGGGLSEEERPGMAAGLARAAFQGMTAGFGDEIVAGVTAGVDRLTGKTSGADLGQLYDAYLGSERGQIEDFREDRPVAAIGAEVAGAIPTALAVPLGAAKAATTLGRAGRGVVIGGAEGGTYGFGAGEGGVQNRLTGAGKTAVLGGAVGGVAPVAATGVRNAYNNLATSSAARSAGMPRPAYEAITRVADADDALTGAGAQRIAAGGPDAMLADAGPSTGSLLDVATQRTGRAAQTARTAIKERVDRASLAVTSSMDNAFGQPVGIRSVETALRRGTAGARTDAYDEAYRGVIDYAADRGREIESIIRTRVPRSAITKANAMMRTEGVRSSQIIAKMGDDGSLVFESMPDVRQIDYITRGLNEVASQADGQGKLGGTTQLGRAYGNLSTELRNLVRDEVPAYATALETAADPIRARMALQIGQKALSPRMHRDELAEELAGMTGAERSHVMKGIRSQIDETLANVKRTMTDADVDPREAMTALKTLSSRAAREKVTMVIGEDRATRLFADLDRAASAFELRAMVAQNSRTFARTSMDDMVRESVDEGIVNRLRAGEPISAGRSAIQIVGGRTKAARDAMTDETYGAIADVLTAPDAAGTLNQLSQSNTRIPGRAGTLRTMTEYYGQRVGVGGSAAAVNAR